MLVYLLVRDVYLNCLCASSMCSTHSLVSVFVSTACLWHLFELLVCDAREQLPACVSASRWTVAGLFSSDAAISWTTRKGFAKLVWACDEYADCTHAWTQLKTFAWHVFIATVCVRRECVQHIRSWECSYQLLVCDVYFNCLSAMPMSLLFN